MHINVSMESTIFVLICFLIVDIIHPCLYSIESSIYVYDGDGQLKQ